MRVTHLCLPRQAAQAGDQGLGHLLRGAFKEPAAAAEEESVACEHQLVISLQKQRI